MGNSLLSDIVIDDDKSGWQLRYPTNTVVSGPALFLDGAPRVVTVASTIDDIDDSLALVDQCRHYRRNNADVVRCKGHFPFGAEVHFTHTGRYAGGFARVTSDYTFPRGTQLNHFAVASIQFSDDWCDYQAVIRSETDWQVEAWRSLADGADEEIATWDIPPMALRLRNIDGTELEIGTGNDLWRWHNGLCGSDTNRGRFILRRNAQGVLFQRWVTTQDDAFSPGLQAYRFSWYVAWQRSPRTSALAPSAVTVPWTNKGDVDLTKLALEQTNAVVIDVTTLPVPDSCRRPDGHPCFAAAGTVRRLKRAVRQLASRITAEHIIWFRGLQPGICMDAAHLDRRGTRMHWDIASIQEFSLWAANCLQPAAVATDDSNESVLLGTRNLFCPLDPDNGP